MIRWCVAGTTWKFFDRATRLYSSASGPEATARTFSSSSQLMHWITSKVSNHRPVFAEFGTDLPDDD